MTTKLYGITHHPSTGDAIIRAPRVYKVGIGVPKGPDIHAYTARVNNKIQWVIRWKKNGGKEYQYPGFETSADARKAYHELYNKCADRKFPEKLSYFTFSRLGADGRYYPAWDAIEANGPQPTEIDIVFNDNQPFGASYQRWGTGKLKCSGNGISAWRSIEFPDPEEKESAAKARAAGLKVFEVKDGCATRGCPYAQPTMKDGRQLPPECKPHGKLQFHLVRAPRLGAVSQFDTTSIRSISNVFSCLDAFFRFTGSGDPAAGFVAGFPLRLVLKPFKVIVPQTGQASTAYAVQLEFRAETVQAMRKKLYEYASQWHSAIDIPKPTAAQIESSLPQLPAPEEEGIQAAIVAAEFTGGEQEQAPGSTADQSTADKADLRIEELSREIAAATGVQTTAPVPAPDKAGSESDEDEIDVVESDEPYASDLFEGEVSEPGTAAPSDPDDQGGKRRRKK